MKPLVLAAALVIAGGSPVDPSPHQMRLITVAPSVQLEVLDWGGTGPTLVFLSGLGNSAHIFDDFALRFRDRFHVVAVTRRGFGRSTNTTGGYDAATRARDIVTVLDSLGARRAVLAGHSIAGDELSTLAATAPERLHALIYLDAYDYGPARVKELASMPSQEALTPQPSAADSASPAAFARYMTRLKNIGGPVPVGELSTLMRFRADGRLEGEVATDAVGKVILGTAVIDFTKVRVPVLGIFNVLPPDRPEVLIDGYWSLPPTLRALADSTYRIGYRVTTTGRERFRTGIPGATIVALTNATHYVFLSAGDRVEQEMRAFLARVQP
ncbi:MAG: alpha/beta hydrolase [Gemmatimonadaceae bacterium]|nr:alpha/beta hydrolase [Gemmatimonadaceae bacterium]